MYPLPREALIERPLRGGEARSSARCEIVLKSPHLDIGQTSQQLVESYMLEAAGLSRVGRVGVCMNQCGCQIPIMSGLQGPIGVIGSKTASQPRRQAGVGTPGSSRLSPVDAQQP
ncbi:hypothetical protein RJZ56_003352 [Blastomyces dermatitidis]|uniref:Uncharacterized protein n=1 Tax=Ajellomyces dermatitidis (strain ER-3 / ATCC MYA-2586) TaxID=559297 RepID=A0ABP2EVP3_AJEDR|nr:uncharacterized protein BDCG_03175 [Blastomyces dermatitidis ER-3]EEQ88055.1 hypothetical protein BDCG_03175 [Blastomyces dermatitidis ER-3]